MKIETHLNFNNDELHELKNDLRRAIKALEFFEYSESKKSAYNLQKLNNLLP